MYILLQGQVAISAMSTVSDEPFAEAVRQVTVHCAERGQLLQRIRKFFGSALRWSRNGDAAKQA